MTCKTQTSGPAKVARLRDRIDRGGTGDKVAFSDPAAAPLGTDDEAAGTPPTEDQVRRAADAELARATPADEKQRPADLQRPSSWTMRGAAWVAALGLAGLVAIMIVWLA